MMMTSQLGLLTETYCILDFSSLGILLSQPITPDSRYDFIADIQGKLIKIQCKTAYPEANDIISIITSSKNWNNGIRRFYTNDIDYFYTYYNNQGYLLPTNLVTEKQRSKRIRLGEKTQYHSNNASATYGVDYRMEEVLKRDFSYTADRVKIEELKFHQRNNLSN